MPTDPHDELAQARARRERGQRVPHPSHPDDAERALEQQAAIERAREAWLLRRAGRDPVADDNGADQE
jgi:hypothetical protein